MKRILLTNFHPRHGGGGGHMRYIRTILESALRREFEFGVAAPDGSAVWSTGHALGAPTFTCDFPGNLKEILQMIRAIRRFDRICQEWKPHLIHMSGSRDQAIVVLWKKFFRQGIPCVRTHHAVRCIPDNLYHRWSYCRMVQGNIYVGHSAKNMAWAGDSLRPQHACVIPNGVDVSFWSPRARDPTLLAELGLTGGDFIFGSHAGMARHKRTDLFLQAAARQLRDGARPFTILLLGPEHEIQGSQRLARELGLKNVVYVRHTPNPRGYLSLIDVGFILSESIETISYAARELMAMGRPLICSNYAGLVENVDDGLNGRLVECGDVKGVAEAIGWFLRLDAESLTRLGQNARLKAERVFCVDRQVQGLLKFYREVFERSAEEPRAGSRKP